MAAAAAVYVPGSPARIHGVIAAVTVLCASVGIVFGCVCALRMRRAGLRLLFAAVGLLIADVTILQRGQSTSYLGLPLSAICSYEVVLRDDSHRLRTGEMIHTGSLVKVCGADGTAASARGPMTVVGGTRSFLWGDRVRCTGRPSVRHGGWAARCSDRGQELLGSTRAYFRLRGAVRDWVERRLRSLRPPDRALFLALFLGARDDLSGPDVYFFRRAGCIHLLALSGFHLGILSFLIVGALSPLVGKRRGMVVAAVLLTGYLFVAGPKVSLVRAVVMFGLLGGCRLVGIRVRGTDLLGATFLFCLIAWPASLDTLSFELSYLALAGIMVASPPLDGAVGPYLPRFLRAPLAASIGAQLATSPLLAGRFGLLYPIGLLSSLLLTPLVTAFLWLGLAYLVVPLPPAAERGAAGMLEFLHRTIVFVAELFARAGPVRIGDARAVLVACAATAGAFAVLQGVRCFVPRKGRKTDAGPVVEPGGEAVCSRRKDFSLQFARHSRNNDL